MSGLVDLASWLLLVSGGLACIVGGVGVLRMPDFYTRVHAASVSDNVGALLLLAGLVLQAGPTLVAAKLVIVGLLVFFTSPVATHAIVRAALASGVEPKLADGEAPWKP
jgi:multicomponent Na+:H+ antiporter subunit G